MEYEQEKSKSNTSKTPQFLTYDHQHTVNWC